MNYIMVIIPLKVPNKRTWTMVSFYLGRNITLCTCERIKLNSQRMSMRIWPAISNYMLQIRVRHMKSTFGRNYKGENFVAH